MPSTAYARYPRNEARQYYGTVTAFSLLTSTGIGTAPRQQSAYLSEFESAVARGYLQNRMHGFGLRLMSLLSRQKKLLSQGTKIRNFVAGTQERV